MPIAKKPKTPSSGSSKEYGGLLEKFIDPKSTLTPGIAGGITFLIACTLYYFFAISQKLSSPILSLLFAIFVASRSKNVNSLQTITLCLLNALIILSISLGAGMAGKFVMNSSPSNATSDTRNNLQADAAFSRSLPSSAPRHFFDSWFSVQDMMDTSVVLEEKWDKVANDKAARLLDKALTETDDPHVIASIEYKYGNLEFQLVGDPPDRQRLLAAMAHYEKGIQADPENASCYLGRGDICRKLGQNNDAIESLQKALKFSNNHETKDTATLSLGRAYRAIGNIGMARQNFKEATNSVYEDTVRQAKDELSTLK